MKSRKSQIIIQSLEDIRSGKYTLEESLSLHPGLSNEIRPLFEIADQFQKQNTQPSEVFKQRARQRLFREMEKPPSPFLDYFGGLLAQINPFHSLRMLGVVLPLCLVTVFGSVLYASRGSLPEDSLYGLKTGFENFGLAITLDPNRKADMRLTLVERRVDEMISLNLLGRPVSPQALDYLSYSLDQALYQMPMEGGVANPTSLQDFTHNAVTQNHRLGEIVEMEALDESQVLYQAYQVTRRSVDLAVIAKSNPQVLQSRVSLKQTTVDTNQFTLRGQLLKIDDEDWIVGGVVLKNVHIVAGEMPSTGAILEVKGLFIEQGTFITTVIKVEMPDDHVTLGGTFVNSGQDGLNWDISGFAIKPPTGLNLPQPGQDYEIQGRFNPDSKSVDWGGLGDHNSIAISGVEAETANEGAARLIFSNSESDKSNPETRKPEPDISDQSASKSDAQGTTINPAQRLNETKVTDISDQMSENEAGNKAERSSGNPAQGQSNQSKDSGVAVTPSILPAAPVESPESHLQITAPADSSLKEKAGSDLEKSEDNVIKTVTQSAGTNVQTVKPEVQKTKSEAQTEKSKNQTEKLEQTEQKN